VYSREEIDEITGKDMNQSSKWASKQQYFRERKRLIAVVPADFEVGLHKKGRTCWKQYARILFYLSLPNNYCTK
jgi:hypothetical protein